MNSVLKKILPVLLLIWPYLCVGPLFFDTGNNVLNSILAWTYISLTVVIYVLNILNACLYKGEDAYYKLAFWNMVIKLVHIPFYLAVFLVGVMMLLASVVPALIFVTPIIVILLFIMDLFMMIASSVYGVNALIRAGKRGVVSKQYALINGILHFFFVADVISSICTFVKIRKCMKK